MKLINLVISQHTNTKIDKETRGHISNIELSSHTKFPFNWKPGWPSMTKIQKEESSLVGTYLFNLHTQNINYK